MQDTGGRLQPVDKAVDKAPQALADVQNSQALPLTLNPNARIGTHHQKGRFHGSAAQLSGKARVAPRRDLC